MMISLINKKTNEILNMANSSCDMIKLVVLYNNCAPTLISEQPAETPKQLAA